MRVTVIITCHNYRDLVGNAIQSVFRQTYSHKSIIVVDDGSSDGSFGEISRFPHDDTLCPLEFIRLDQSIGQASAKNLALRQAWDKTDLFAFLDADDCYREDKLARCVPCFIQDPAVVGLVYNDEIIHDRILGVCRINYKEPFSENIGGVQGNFLVSRRALEVVGHFDPTMKVMEDYDLSRRIMKKFVALHIPHPLDTTTLTNRALRSHLPLSDWNYFRGVAHAKK